MYNSILNKVTIFKGGEDFNSNSFRIPFLAVTNKGTIIAGGDIRYTDSTDYNNIDIGIARSEDGGKTWIDKQIIIKNNGLMEHSRKMDGCIIVDKQTGRIFVFALSLDLHAHLDCNNNEKQSLVYVYSDDDGKTWSEEISLRHLYDDDCILFFQGPGNGIQLTDGTLVIPVQRWVENTQKHRSFAGIVYSKDNGKTWHRSKKLIETYTSESAIIEYKENEILISCRSPLINTRGFYTTKNLGDSWEEHESNNTILEFGGCQSSLYKFKAPNEKTYGLYVAVQQFDSLWERKKLTLFVSEDYLNWNKVSEIVDIFNYGYSCVTYNEKLNELYILTEYDDSLHFYNLTSLLPNIMQNTPSFNEQALSKIHEFPTYSKGHYFNIRKKDNWYKIANIKIKKNAFCFLSLNFLGFNTNTNLTLKINQKETFTNFEHIQFTKQQFEPNKEQFALVPIAKENDYFIYEIFYRQDNTDKLSISVLNSLCSNFDNANFRIYTNFQDDNIEDNSVCSLPILKLII